MSKGAKIAIAIVACLAIWLVFAIINAASGSKHGGGIIVMMIMFAIITAVWRAIVGKKGDDDKETITVNLHVGSGEDRKDFEAQLTQDEIVKMADIRKQDPQKWEDNDYELIKKIKPDFIVDELEKRIIDETKEPQTQTIKLKQDDIIVSMTLSDDIIKHMAKIREFDYKKWDNNEVELVREAQKALKAKSVDSQLIEKQEETKANESLPEDNQIEEDCTQTTEDITPIVEVKPVEEPVQKEITPKTNKGLFGNKLESEYRREIKTESHMIRQDDIEICINIEDPVYQKMIELQCKDPKKWVNKELDLFKQAKQEVEAL